MQPVVLFHASPNLLNYVEMWVIQRNVNDHRPKLQRNQFRIGPLLPRNWTVRINSLCLRRTRRRLLCPRPQSSRAYLLLNISSRHLVWPQRHVRLSCMGSAAIHKNDNNLTGVLAFRILNSLPQNVLKLLCRVLWSVRWCERRHLALFRIFFLPLRLVAIIFNIIVLSADPLSLPFYNCPANVELSLQRIRLHENRI